MSTQDTEFQQFPRSRTLENIGISPQTVCVSCPNAVWYAATHEPKNPQVFCKLFHSTMDIKLTECDGNPNIPARLDLPQISAPEQIEMTMEQYIAGQPDPDTPPTLD